MVQPHWKPDKKFHIGSNMNLTCGLIILVLDTYSGGMKMDVHTKTFSRVYVRA